MSDELPRDIDMAIQSLVEACVIYGCCTDDEDADGGTRGHKATVTCEAALRAAIRAALPATPAPDLAKAAHDVWRHSHPTDDGGMDVPRWTIHALGIALGYVATPAPKPDATGVDGARQAWGEACARLLTARSDEQSAYGAYYRALQAERAARDGSK